MWRIDFFWRRTYSSQEGGFKIKVNAGIDSFKAAIPALILRLLAVKVAMMVYQNRMAIRYAMNAMIQAMVVLYIMENAVYFHEPVSRVIAASVAMQGK